MVVVRATSGAGERVKMTDQTITVTVTDVGGEAPGVPVAPTVSSASVTSLTATWTAPANAGPAITDYDYQYRVTSPVGDWTEVTTTTITALSATITQLTEGTEYDVQVRGDEWRGYERLVGFGQRLDGRERVAVVHLAGDVQRAGEPDRGGYGSCFGQRHGRQRDGLRDPGRRGRLEVLDRPREWRPDVRFGT